MLAVLCTHEGDLSLSLPLARHIKAMGGVSEHEILIVAPNETDIEELRSIFSGCFKKTNVMFYPATMRGWPFGANEAAATAMLTIYGNPQFTGHYLMLEPDCVPGIPEWLDRIDAAYKRCGSPVMGVMVDTVEIDTKRVVGRHCVGVAVYPKDFARLCPLVRSTTDMTHGFYQQRQMPKPWDAYFGPYTAKMTANTDLIQHLRRARQETPQGVRWDCPSLESALKQVDSRAVLIHGSKDPAFLPALTGTPQEQVIAKPIVDAPIPVIPQPQSIPLPKSDAPKGKLTHEERAAIKKQKDKELWKKENNVEFEVDTPEFKRSVSIYADSSITWPNLKSYASRVLGIAVHKKTRSALINDIVRSEKEQNKTELWPVPPVAPYVPVEEAPPVAFTGVSTANQTGPWKPVDRTPEEGNALSPEKREQMRLLYESRQQQQNAVA